MKIGDSFRPAVHGAIDYGQESFELVRQCHQLLSGFLVKSHLPLVSRQSHLPANDNGDNEVIKGHVHISPDTYLIADFLRMYYSPYNNLHA